MLVKYIVFQKSNLIFINLFQCTCKCIGKCIRISANMFFPEKDSTRLSTKNIPASYNICSKACSANLREVSILVEVKGLQYEGDYRHHWLNETEL